MLSSELFRSALESAPDAMIISDGDGFILFANHQVTALFGYERDEIIGERIECLLPERFRARHIVHRTVFVADARTRPMGAGLDLFARRKDGTEFPVGVSLSSIRDDGRMLVAAAIRDVTHGKRVEGELTVAREAADRANQSKSRFLATASHDLRQPLQSLALLNGALRRIVTHPDAVEALVQQDQAISVMSRLLNALLDISKLEAGAIKPEPIDFPVAAVLAELRNEFASLAADKGLRLQIEPSMDYVHSDPSLVSQILRNLISNAIKYTREGWVRLRCVHQQSVVRLEVLDSGIGIPTNQLGHIYDEFYQVGVSANNSRAGYGLGLSIVRRLVTLLDLTLDVQSEVGKGSVFALELPASVTQPGAGAARLHRSAPAGRPAVSQRVLLVEDDAAVRDSTRMLLKVEGYRVLTAASLAEALETAGENADIDLVITDYHLSGEDTGAQVLSGLRAILGADLKAIVVTGDTSSVIQELRRDNRLLLASKPVNAEELLALMRSLLSPRETVEA